MGCRNRTRARSDRRRAAASPSATAWSRASTCSTATSSRRLPSRASAATPTRSWPASTPSPAARRGRSPKASSSSSATASGPSAPRRGPARTCAARSRSARPRRGAVRLAHRRLRSGALDLDHARRRRGERPRRLPHDDARLRRRAVDRRRTRPRSPRRPISRSWTAHPADGLADFAFPLPGEDGEVFAAAIDARTRHKVAVRFAGGRYERVFDSTKALRAWRGPHGSVWVLEGTRTWRLNGGQREAVARYGPLSGIVYDVVTEPRGVFWIASTTGLGRYAPQLWRTPDAIKGLDQPVHSVVEDAQGRLWFAATEALLELDGDTWRVHPMPQDTQTVPNQSASLAILPDGRLAMTANIPGTPIVTAFDPRTGAFTRLQHPDGRGLWQLWRGRGDRILVRTAAPCAIEIWDGRGHHPVPALSAPGFCEKMRELHDAADGSLWFGTTGMGGGVLRPGATTLERFGPGDGYSELAVYSLLAPTAERVLAGGRDVLAERVDGRWTVRQRALDAVRSLMQAHDGTIWIASGSGVHRLKDGVWLTNGEADGLPADGALQGVRGQPRPGLGRHRAGAEPLRSDRRPRSAAHHPGQVERRGGAARRQRQHRLQRRRSLEVHAGRSAALLVSPRRRRVVRVPRDRQRPAAAGAARPPSHRGPGDGSQRQPLARRDLRLRRAVPAVPAPGLPDERGDQPDGHRRAARLRARPVPAARPRQAGGRDRQPLQERVPGAHEPRDPHAHERDHGDDGAGQGRDRRRRTARLPRDGADGVVVAAGAAQRHPRSVEGRSRQAAARRGQLRRAPVRPRRAGDAAAAGGREGPRDAGGHRARRAAVRRRRRAARPPGGREPARQRHQVHRDRRGDGPRARRRCGRARVGRAPSPCASASRTPGSASPPTSRR